MENKDRKVDPFLRKPSGALMSQSFEANCADHSVEMLIYHNEKFICDFVSSSRVMLNI